ncbi:MAG TPA: sulfatase-like hydrolase/transferase [Acidobacteriaceae bacterium]|nr:sulfatase-like hydrolase/transferase [Acidobacteriaceae bacterium]
MNRRAFLLTAGAAACSAALPAYGVEKRRPNIVIITTDEQSFDAVSYRVGKQYLHTPHIDCLAANGVAFNRAYCADPICVASRTAMFTGRYPTETGVVDNSDLTRVHLDPRKFPNMGKIFRQGGYNTAYFGKWHIACPKDDVDTHGFTTIATTLNDEVAAASAVNYLHSKPRAPFLMVASLLNPHNICEWARGEKLPLGPIGNPPPVDECPPLRANHAPQHNEPDIISLMRRSYHGTWMFPVGNFSEAKWREYEWAYYRLAENADAHVGIVLNALRDAGLEQNTLVVFLSDHGDCQGAHGWNQKTVFYDEASHVPFILSHKGVLQPGKSNRLVNTGIDLVPTLCDYAGVAAPPGLPGISLRRPEPHPRQYVILVNRLVQGAPIDGEKPTPSGRMLRSQRFKYCAYNQGKQRESLVDMEKDPGEMWSLAYEPRYHNVLHQHRAMLRKWCASMHDDFPVPSS